jgi:hypothetical protein
MRETLDGLRKLFLRYWWLGALIFIFLFAYYIRAINIVPDRLLSFDPVYFYRYLRYFVEFGTFPVWDELTYYVGRAVITPPLLIYLTAAAYFILERFGFSLMTTAAYTSAVIGAAMTIPAFLLGRELSNKYGGLLAAVLIGTAPQILIRTFGASFDTDHIAVLFILLTTWAGLRMLKHPTPFNFCLAAGSFIGFVLAWGMYWYTWFFLIGTTILYFLVASAFGDREWFRDSLPRPRLADRAIAALRRCRSMFTISGVLFVTIFGLGYMLGRNPMSHLLSMLGFAFRPEVWIVNISIAELQLINLADIGSWMLMTGRFITGTGAVDVLLFLTFMALVGFGLWQSWRKGALDASFLLIMFALGIVTTIRGIRFTEFSSALILPVVAIGYGHFVEFCRRDDFLRSFSLGLGFVIAVIAIGLSLQIGQQLGPDINANWDSAWAWIRDNTPRAALIGTWWDPGHMIAGFGERRNIADGAHCSRPCLWTINDRITDLGRIMATTDEKESIQLIHKYQGTSPKVYWIASDDLIGKFQWLQYFGTGCDARTEQRCPLYYQLPLRAVSQMPNGQIFARHYGNVIVIEGVPPVPIFVQGRIAAVLEEVIYYDNTEVKIVNFDALDITQLLEQLKPLKQQLRVKFSNQTMQLTAWVPTHQQYIVLIPPNQRNTIFTKMFMLEGRGLEHFKQVYRNEQVKIYEVEI